MQRPLVRSRVLGDSFLTQFLDTHQGVRVVGRSSAMIRFEASVVNACGGAKTVTCAAAGLARGLLAGFRMVYTRVACLACRAA